MILFFASYFRAVTKIKSASSALAFNCRNIKKDLTAKAKNYMTH